VALFSHRHTWLYISVIDRKAVMSLDQTCLLSKDLSRVCLAPSKPNGVPQLLYRNPKAQG